MWHLSSGYQAISGLYLVNPDELLCHLDVLCYEYLNSKFEGKNDYIGPNKVSTPWFRSTRPGYT